jgi:hypothetical protein
MSANLADGGGRNSLREEQNILLDALLTSTPPKPNYDAQINLIRKDFEHLSLLYQENAKVAAIFWEWRHKVMTSFFTGVAALFALIGWFYKEVELRPFIFAPFILGAVFALIAKFLDQRNGDILKACYAVGKEIEGLLLRNNEGIFSRIDADQSKVRYTRTLMFVYLCSAILFLILALISIKVLL